MIKAPMELKQLYHQGRLIPFIGAGVSMSVSWTTESEERRGPSWREFVDEAARQLGFLDPELLRVRGTDLQILEYYRLREQTLAPLNNWLVKRVCPPEDALLNSPIHQELARSEKCLLMYTTNFDELLERALRALGRQCNVVVIEAHIGSRSNVCEIVKFHGDLNHPGHMVLSESDFERRLRLESPMDLRLRADILGRVLLFLGYSFRDYNVAYLFRLMNDQLKGMPSNPSGRRAYIVVPEPSDFEIRLFRERNIEVIAVSSELTTEDIAALLKDMRS